MVPELCEGPSDSNVVDGVPRMLQERNQLNCFHTSDRNYGGLNYCNVNVNRYKGLGWGDSFEVELQRYEIR